MRKVSLKEKETLLKLDGKKRFEYFIKFVADTEIAWGLWSEGGWALYQDDDGTNVFPIWPASEYAEACRQDEWEEYAPVKISVSDLLDELLPKLRSSGTEIGIFPTPTDRGVIPGIDAFQKDLQSELRKYE